MAGAARRLMRDGPRGAGPSPNGPPGGGFLRMRDLGTGHLVVVAAGTAGLVLD
jgi:hypothetical protein